MPASWALGESSLPDLQIAHCCCVLCGMGGGGGSEGEKESEKEEGRGRGRETELWHRFLKDMSHGTSLVKWLRLCAPSAGEQI